MDLLQSVRKSGSRGGVNFSWDEVKGSAHRENYLGHSLMAPVGRWQKNRDLGWYAKADDAELTSEERAEKEALAKAEEKRKVKEAEEDAMAKMLGLPVKDRSNANLEPLGLSREKQGEVNRALKETLGDEGKEERVGVNESKPREERRRRHRSRSRERRREHDDEERSVRRRKRSRSPSRDRERDRDRERRHRHKRDDRSRSHSKDRDRRRHRSRSREHDRDRRREDERHRQRGRERGHDKRREDDRHQRHRDDR